MLWYVVAGCVNQTVWNYLTGREIEYGIGDYDIVYWDDDVSKEAEIKVQNFVKKALPNIKAELEVINQARVHLWFEEDFGEKIEPFLNIEHAISTWPNTVTCVGIKKTAEGYSVFAPYGVSDIFSMSLRPNFPIMGMEGYKAKLKKWKSKWAELKVIESRTLV